MSNVLRYWIGFSTTIGLAMLSGHLTSYIIDPGFVSLLTSFALGGIIGIVGFELTKRWVNEAEDSL